MSKYQAIVLKSLRRLYRKIYNPQFEGFPWPEEHEWEDTSHYISKLLVSNSPILIGRIGTSENAIINNYLTVHSSKSYVAKCLDYVTDNTRLPFWDTERPFFDLQNNSGFFTEDGMNIKDAERFAEIYLKYIPQMDLCGRFSDPEKHLPFSSNCKMVQLESLYPFFSSKPWTECLKDKKVLVVHPFKESILHQFKNRENLFHDPRMLPDFHLEVIKAVQSIAGEKCAFPNWFEALEHMMEEISKRDFDVLIVGCGAYGLPLAGFGKEIGKKAIHLGGGTQLLFGIKGKRWEGKYHGDDTRFNDLFNEYWIYPNQNETPVKANNIEGGCYW